MNHNHKYSLFKSIFPIVASKVINQPPLLIVPFVLIFYLFIILNSTLVFYSDDAIYATIAKYWINLDWSHIFHPTWPPFYPLVSALIYFFTHNLENSSRIVSAISASLVLIPLYKLTLETTSKIVAVIFIVLVAFLTPIIDLALSPHSDMLSTFLLISAMVSFFFYLQKLKLTYLIISGLLFALTYLTRAEGSLFFTLSFFYLSVYCLKTLIQNRKPLLNFLLPIVVFTITFFFIASPYMLAVGKQIGGWPLSAKFSAQIQQGHAFALNDFNETWAQDIDSVNNPNYQSPYYKNGVKFMLDNFDYLLKWAIQKYTGWQNLFYTVFPFWSLIFIITGFTKIVEKKYINLNYFLFILFTTIPITIFSTSINDIRYLLWTVPLLLYFFILGTMKFFSLFSKKASLIFIPTLLVLLFPGSSLHSILNPEKLVVEYSAINNRPYFIEVANWIKNQSIKNPKIMMRHESVTYYAEGEMVYLPQTSYQKMIDYAKKHDVDYLVSWHGELSTDTELSSLLDKNIKHQDLQVVYSQNNQGNTIIVYKLINKTN